MKQLVTSSALILTFVLMGISGARADLPQEIDKDDLIKMDAIRPTTYYIPSEDQTPCKGRYGSTRYTGKEFQNLYTPEGKFIAKVCKYFASVLLMEGSGILKDRGAGEIVVNFGRKIKGVPRYRILDHCKYGQGVRHDLCLLPYHTLAADNKKHKVNEIIYVPAAQGLKLPDGSIHDGNFIVRDTGGAFRGVGAQRVDMFVGTDPDTDNAFQRAGFDRKHPLKAYKVKGPSADRVREKLREKFGDLY